MRYNSDGAVSYCELSRHVLTRRPTGTETTELKKLQHGCIDTVAMLVLLHGGLDRGAVSSSNDRFSGSETDGADIRVGIYGGGNGGGDRDDTADAFGGSAGGGTRVKVASSSLSAMLLEPSKPAVGSGIIRLVTVTKLVADLVQISNTHHGHQRRPTQSSL
jgi:hypothetical protein